MQMVLVAALITRMTAAGGAGADFGREAERQQAGASWGDVRRHFSTLRSEVSTLQKEFRDAREAHRREAERKQ
jgi:hypothetical protein